MMMMRRLLDLVALLALVVGIFLVLTNTPPRAQPPSSTNVCTAVNSCAAQQKFLSAATTNSNSVTASRTALTDIIAMNTTTTLYYLKLYDKASAPTCNSDTVKATYPVPFQAANAGGGFHLGRIVPPAFLLGLGFCLTGGIADNDNASAATGLAINFEYLGGV